jgi:hypothetical protein
VSRNIISIADETHGPTLLAYAVIHPKYFDELKQNTTWIPWNTQNPIPGDFGLRVFDEVLFLLGADAQYEEETNAENAIQVMQRMLSLGITLPASASEGLFWFKYVAAAGIPGFYPQLIVQLLENGASPYVVDRHGNTLLHALTKMGALNRSHTGTIRPDAIAAEKSSRVEARGRIVDICRHKGIDFFTKNPLGKTPIDMMTDAGDLKDLAETGWLTNDEMNAIATRLKAPSTMDHFGKSCLQGALAVPGTEVPAQLSSALDVLLCP